MPAENNTLKFPGKMSKATPLPMGLVEELAKHVKPDGYTRMSDGTVYQRDDKGTLTKVEIKEDKGTVGYWVKRATAAEAENDKLREMTKLLCKERDMLRDRLLAMCLAIRQRGFRAPSDDAEGTGPIESFPPFLDIERFARGAPKEQGTPLRELPMDGKREVKRIKSNDIVIECGHIIIHKPGDAWPKIRERVVCELCTAMLKERGELVETP